MITDPRDAYWTAIIDNDRDDDAKLTLADWLDEHGEDADLANGLRWCVANNKWPRTMWKQIPPSQFHWFVYEGFVYEYYAVVGLPRHWTTPEMARWLRGGYKRARGTICEMIRLVGEYLRCGVDNKHTVCIQ